MRVVVINSVNQHTIDVGHAMQLIMLYLGHLKLQNSV